MKFSLRNISFVSGLVVGGGGAVADCALNVVGVAGDGGGDTFDGYPVGDLAQSTTLPLCSSLGFSGTWLIANDKDYMDGTDGFESYPLGAVTTNTLNGGTGFSGAWLTN